MNALLSHIKGKFIRSIEKTDSWHISFGDVFLTIHNPVTIEPAEKGNNPNSLRDLMVEDVKEYGSNLSIIMSSNVVLRINLSPEAYTGPEAMTLKTHDKFIVW